MCPRTDGVNGRAVIRVPGAQLVAETHLCQPADVSGWAEILRTLAWGLVSGMIEYVPDGVPFEMALTLGGLQLQPDQHLTLACFDATHPVNVYAEAWRWKISKPRKRKGV